MTGMRSERGLQFLEAREKIFLINDIAGIPIQRISLRLNARFDAAWNH